MNPVSAFKSQRPEAASDVKQQICQAVVSTASRHFAGRLLTVILTGSMARDEATFRSTRSGSEVLGDAEFVLVFSELPERLALESFIADAQRTCAATQVVCKIDCSAVRPQYFNRLQPSIYGYELLTCGEVLSGDSKIVLAAQRFSANAIPKEDGLRILCNRLIELLEVLPENSASLPRPDVDYRAMKLNLDLATSILVFAGLYQPGYEDRTRIFQEGQSQLPQLTGIDMAQFCKELCESSDAKLGRIPIPHFDQSRLQQVINRALDVCSWELRQMLAASPSPINSYGLMRLWMGRQSLLARLRGWAYVAREQGWLSNLGKWPCWGRMAITASPRYWIYAAAMQAAQQFAAGEAKAVVLDKNELPLKSQSFDSQADFRKEIARNYRECVVGTTA